MCCTIAVSDVQAVIDLRRLLTAGSCHNLQSK
jgi:hypothetical protein